MTEKVDSEDVLRYAIGKNVSEAATHIKTFMPEVTAKFTFGKDGEEFLVTVSMVEKQ